MAVLYKIVVDCVDPHRLAAFWAVALDYLLEDHSALVQRLLHGGVITEADARTVDGRPNSARSASTRSSVAATAASGSPTRRPAQDTQALSTSGRASASC